MHGKFTPTASWRSYIERHEMAYLLIALFILKKHKEHRNYYLVIANN